MPTEPRATVAVPILLGSIALAILALHLCFLSASVASAQEQTANELVRVAAAHELAAAKQPQTGFMFRARKQTAHGSQNKLYVETKDALAGMVIAYDDQPLTAQQLENEENHLAGLINNPEQLRRKAAQEREDADRTLRIVKALPDAFLYEYDPEAVSPEKTEGQIRLKFRPNPAYSPPSRVEQVLAGMQGYVAIDAASRRISAIDGTLFRDVTFGWGIFGHLDKGGHFLVEQGNIGNGSWDITRMSLSFTGKILLFKSLNITSDEVFSRFTRVAPDLTFAQGVELLKAEQAKLAKESQSQSLAKDKGQH